MAADPGFAKFIGAVTVATRQIRCPTTLTAEIHGHVVRLLRDWTIADRRYCALHPERPYGSFLLYQAPDDAFVVILDTFTTHQATAIHNHRTWAVVGLIQGCERDRRYVVPPALDAPPRLVSDSIAQSGEVSVFQELEFHQLESVGATDSMSLHVYGADVGRIRRLCWDENERCYTEFAQDGYSNEAFGLPVYHVDPTPGHPADPRSAADAMRR